MDASFGGAARPGMAIPTTRHIAASHRARAVVRMVRRQYTTTAARAASGHGAKLLRELGEHRSVVDVRFLRRRVRDTRTTCRSRSSRGCASLRAMSEEMGKAMDEGDWARAHALFVRQPDAGTPGGIANAALLLAMAGQYDQAEQQLARTQAPAVEWIVRGDRARLARWRDPKAAGGLAVARPTATSPFYAGMAIALLTNDAALVDKLFTDFGASFRPVAGRITLRSGQLRPFDDLRDSDDAIGQMF